MAKSHAGNSFYYVPLFFKKGRVTVERDGCVTCWADVDVYLHTAQTGTDLCDDKQGCVRL